MEGSNINKLRSKTLKISWNEKDCCSMLIKRLPYFEFSTEDDLKEPKKLILKQFPNEIFAEKIKDSNINRYSTNFYAYLVAVTFNRPRDFLELCYAMRKRLSKKRPAVFKNIQSAELEYIDYFVNEIQDELYFLCKILKIDTSLSFIQSLIYDLSKEETFGFSQLKNIMAQVLGIKASNSKVTILIKDLWRYGLLGFQYPNNPLINFSYVKNSKPIPSDKNLLSLTYSLHKGLFWAQNKAK